MAKYTKDNRFEIPDPTPIELPVGFEHPEPLEEMIARMIRVAGQNAAREGFETFEEADDFDVDDDETIESEYQLKEMKDEYPVREPKRERGSRRERENRSGISEGDDEERGSVGKGEKAAPKQKARVVEKMAEADAVEEAQ